MEEKKYAVLIDGDNISSKYLDSILNEMTKYGIGIIGAGSIVDMVLQHIKEYIVILQASSHQNGGDL